MDVPKCPDGELARPEGLSFPEVFRTYAPFLWRALLGLGVAEADAEDLCQEVMLVVHRRLADFDGRSLRSWLYGICVRVASDYRRSARVRREVVTEAPTEAPSTAGQGEAFEQSWARLRLMQVLAELDDGKRDVFVLYELEQLTLKETAEAVGCPLQTAYSRLEAARAFINARFSEPREGCARAAG